MARKSVKRSTAGRAARLSRRDLLQAAAVAALGLPSGARGATVAPDAVAPTPWWLAQFPERSRVVDAHASSVVHGASVDEMNLRDLLGRTIRELTAARSIESGWKMILGDARRIAVKFNQVGADVIGTSTSFARQIVHQLNEAGYPSKEIMLIETPPNLRHELETREPPVGWGGHLRVADQDDQFARYVLEADAIINVALLKTHQIAGMTGCLKNISHGIVRHPGRYHAQACAPFITQIFGHPEVTRRVRLNLLDGLRMVIRNGPDAREADIVNYGGLLAGFDPVAVDQIGLTLLALERRQHGLPGYIDVPALEYAARRRLGRAHPADIQRIAFEMS